MRYFALAAGLFLVMTGMSFAADIDGTWTGSLDMGGQAMPVGFTFKAEGTTLTGTMPGMPGPDGSPAKPIAIKNGKIDGNNISFSVSIAMGEQEMKIDYKGVLSGESLKINGEAMGNPFEFTLKKAK
jgi:hypothetical protein